MEQGFVVVEDGVGKGLREGRRSSSRLGHRWSRDEAIGQCSWFFFVSERATFAWFVIELATACHCLPVLSLQLFLANDTKIKLFVHRQ